MGRLATRVALAALLAGALAPVGDAAAAVYFRRAGEVWRVDPAGTAARAVTRSGGTVERFEVSRDGRHLAYEAIAGYVDDAGEWEDGEAPPKRAVTHIHVVELRAGGLVTRVRPTDEPFVHILRWLGDGRLVYYTAGFFDVASHFALDPVTGASHELAGEAGLAVATRSDQTADGRLRVWVGPDQTLRVLDLGRPRARPLLGRPGLLAPALSPDGARVAAVQVDWQARPRVDRLIVADVADGASREVLAGPVRPKSGPGLAWSPDGRFVSMLWPPEAVVLDPRDPNVVHRVRGRGFAWLDGETLLVERGTGVLAYRLGTRGTAPFLDDAADVRVAPR